MKSYEYTYQQALTMLALGISMVPRGWIRGPILSLEPIDEGVMKVNYLTVKGMNNHTVRITKALERSVWRRYVK